MDPAHAANVALTIWQMLHAASEGSRDTSDRRPAEDLPPAERDRASAAVQERLDRLLLVVHAMWTLLAEKAGITEAELARRITDLDAADGTLDGHVSAPPVRCSCGAMVCRKLARCLFCGKPYQAGSAFETL